MYTSTRDNSVRVSAAQAIANGISKDGGLFVPTQIPVLSSDELKELVRAEQLLFFPSTLLILPSRRLLTV